MFVKILPLLCVASLSFSVASEQRWYWAQTDFLRRDPTENAAVKTLVYQGAWMTLQHCTDQGWCFGEVYGYDEGWVPRRLLTEARPELKSKEGLMSGLGGNESRARRYHLQDRRKFYGMISNTFAWGAVSAESASQAYSGFGSWTFRAALGWHWGPRPLNRWGSEFSFGHERISLSSSEGEQKLSATQLVGGVSIVRMAPYSHTWGLGWRARLSFPLSRSFSEDLETEPSSWLFAVGPVWSHGVPSTWPKPEWMEWELMLKAGLSQWQLLLGSNFVF